MKCDETQEKLSENPFPFRLQIETPQELSKT